MTGRTPWERCLGGSESAMVFVARALAARGHEVEIFTRCEAPGEYDGVVYRDITTLHQEAALRDWDVFVSLRFIDILQMDVRANLRVLWCQDVISNFQVSNWALYCDRLIFVSHWHQEQTQIAHPTIKPISRVIVNPVDNSMIPEKKQTVDPILVHLSRPERGLRPLLDIWPSIVARVPNAKLVVARYRSFNEPRGSEIEAFCLAMDERVRSSPNAVHLGNLSKPDLYQLLSHATMLVYPAEFDETSCIAAIESQACGLPVIAVARGALPETLDAGASILVNPGPFMREDFSDRVVELLYDVERRQKMSQAGKLRALQHDVVTIAAQWEAMFEEGLKEIIPLHQLPSKSSLYSRWPGFRSELWNAIAERCPKEVQVIHPPLDIDALAMHGIRINPNSKTGVLDFGVLAADDPVEYINKLSCRYEVGTKVISVIVWAIDYTGKHTPDAKSIAAWFPNATEHGLTLEAQTVEGEPARCWIISWQCGDIAQSPPIHYGRRARHSVSTCMIVRNAADTIRTTLNSILPIADEIRILDTGSIDATCHIIEEFRKETSASIVVEHMDWPDDFAVARNRSIQDAQGDWILWIDADERLINGEHLRRLVQTRHYEAIAIRQHNHIFDRGITQVEIPCRLFRNGKGYRFYGAVHEHPEVSLNIAIEPWILSENVDILHYGYLTEAGRVQKMLARNLRLLNLDFEKYPGRQLTEILYLRDCVNLCYFDKRDHGRIRMDHQAALRAALERFEYQSTLERGRYYHVGRRYYEQGLGILDEGIEIEINIGDRGKQIHRVRHVDDGVYLASTEAKNFLAARGIK